MSSASHAIVPTSPAFLDPLFDIETCYYYAVPQFYGFHHPNTRWLIAMIKGQVIDRVRRKMELSPELFKGKYFQMMDYPRLYYPHDPSLVPMFKRQSVLYLSVLGMSIYLRSFPLVDLILFHKDPYDEVMSSVNEPQFASHLQDLKYGDFHSFPPCLIMLRMYCFESAPSLLQAGWNPSLPFAMPMRRKYERRVFYFYDWLEVALGLLSERPLYPLQSLILNMTKSMPHYKYLFLPITQLLPPTPKDRVPTGLVDVDDLPTGTRMIGVRSLLEMAEDYDRYLQMRSCAQEVAALKREAVAVGLNPEILMIQALDYDGYTADKSRAQEGGNNAWRGARLGTATIAQRHWTIEHDTRQAVNANNSATDAVPALLTNTNTSAKKKEAQPNYASEACRILFYAVEKDKSCKRMQVCLDAIIVLSRRGFFINNERLAPETKRARDIRNVIVLMLSLLQREYDKLDVIFAKIQSGYKKFEHLDEHKMLENRRLASVLNISKIVAAITRVLLHAKELVFFVSSEFPPYPASFIDFKLEPRLVNKFNDIKGGVVQEFNSIKDGWTHLSKEMIKEVAKIKSMQLHFKVGLRPSTQAILEAKKAARKSAMKNRPKNMSNTNSCFVTFKKIQRPSRRRCGAGGRASDVASSDGEQQKQQRQQQQQQLSSTADFSCDMFDNSDLATSSDRICREPAQSPSALKLGDQPDDDLAASEAEDAQLLRDIADDCEALSQTGLLMTNLCREVEDLLKPRLKTCSDILPISTTKDPDADVSTIEPDPRSSECNSNSRGSSRSSSSSNNISSVVCCATSFNNFSLDQLSNCDQLYPLS